MNCSALTTEIVSAHVGNNAVTGGDVAGLIQSVFDTLSGLGSEEAAPAALTPAVPIKRSVTDDYIICLEDGKKLKMLKRHLMTAYDMTPGGVPGEVGPQGRLSDGRAELRPQAAGTRQEDRAGAEAARRRAGARAEGGTEAASEEGGGLTRRCSSRHRPRSAIQDPIVLGTRRCYLEVHRRPLAGRLRCRRRKKAEGCFEPVSCA